ncbi:MAG: type I glyceraldehyde-3-phosphate dehydrogenase [Armatimonadota bacterium]
MAVKVGINGFGRIGRQVFKAIWENYREDLEIVAVNDLTDDETLAHLLKYDSIYGRFDGTVETGDSELIVDGVSIRTLEERDPAALPWGELGAEIVLESTGFFRSTADAGKHIEAGAKKVIISAPAKDECPTFVLGVNGDEYDPGEHNIVSNASCTTNCLAPLAKVLNDSFGVVRGLMTTVHSYTNDQAILDGPHKDLRRARAAAMNIIPTSTGAAAAIGVVIPELDGKLNGMAMRVPTPTGSVVDLTVELEKGAGVDEINAAFEQAASEAPLQGYLTYASDPIVLQDIVGDPSSCVYDAGATYEVGGNFVKVLGWYDNEWGYSNRTADLMKIMADMGL